MANPEFLLKEGFIYCADTPEGYIKIGFTIGVEAKARYIQHSVDTCWPNRKKSCSRMLAFFRGTQGEELDIHRKFQDFQVKRLNLDSACNLPKKYKSEWYRHLTPPAQWFFSQPSMLYDGEQYFPESSESRFQPIGDLLQQYEALRVSAA